MAAALVAIASSSVASVPSIVNYQGVLTDEGGNPLSGDDYDLTFRIYPDTLGAASLWEESHSPVSVDNGLFHLMLGSVTSFPPDLFDSAERWLSIQVGDGPEMEPWMRLASVPYAAHAAVADSLAGPHGDGDDDWLIVGDDMYANVSGGVGIGTDEPLRTLHLMGSNLNLPETALTNDRLVIESGDAALGIYSYEGGGWGSCINLGEIDQGALTNKWSMVRTPGATGVLKFRFGTDPDYANNATVADMWLEDGNSTLRVVSTGTSGSTLQLRGSEDKRGSLEFVDGNNEVDAEVDYYSVPPYGIPALRFRTDNTTRMQVTSGGRVGIGSFDMFGPDRQVEIADDEAAYLRITGGAGWNGGYLELKADDTIGELGTINFLNANDEVVASVTGFAGFDGSAMQFNVGGTRVLDMYNDGGVHVPSHLHLEPKTSFPPNHQEGDVFVLNEGVGANHIWCYLNGTWHRLD